MASNIMRAFPLGKRRTQVRRLNLPTAFAVVLTVIALISLLYLAQTSAVATAGYDVKRLEDQKAQLEMKNEQLRTRIAQLQSLERVETEGAKRLKMGPPANVLFVPVDLRASTADVPAASASSVRSGDGSAKENQGPGKGQRDNSWLNALRGTLGL